MKLTKFMILAALSVSTLFANASGANSDYSLSNISCTDINADHVHLNCTLSNSSGDQSELSASLINYDVKNSAGKIIATGYGNSVYIDKTKLAPQEEYSIIVYALVNGTVVSQTLTRQSPAK